MPDFALEWVVGVIIGIAILMFALPVILLIALGRRLPPGQRPDPSNPCIRCLADRYGEDGRKRRKTKAKGG